jgi:hypothetical protein
MNTFGAMQAKKHLKFVFMNTSGAMQAKKKV